MRFLQSGNDFPVTVSLGRDSPSWELNRWGRDTLRFHPLEGETFSLRGNTRYVQYTGRKESHRFTILDRERFEYDIILNREPESNVLYLGIEGWEGFDFFKQPDTLGPEMLRGSYAVYKKETVINSPVYHVGTGKLCHIHRPKIIDARGREVWGDVEIDRGMMVIRIPEGWLGEAEYPVVVDPVIGSNAAGAYTTYKYLPSYCYDDWYNQVIVDREPDDFTEEMELELNGHAALNKYKTPLPMLGTYNCRVYFNKAPYSAYFPYFYTPLMFTENGGKPKHLLNTNIRTNDMAIGTSNPAGWYGGEIRVGSITANTDIWFGFYGESKFGLRFDYGAPFYMPNVEGAVIRTEDFEYWYGEYDDPFTEYLNDSGIEDISGQTDPRNDSASDERNVYPGQRTDFKASMYFEIVQQNYTRTLTQGVKLSDRGNRIQGLVRRFTEALPVKHEARRVYDTVRRTGNTAGIHEEVKRGKGMYRLIVGLAKATDSTGVSRALGRIIQSLVGAVMGLEKKRDLWRGIEDCAASEDTASRSLGIFSFVQTLLKAYDGVKYSNQWGRNISDNAAVSMEKNNTARYIRELWDSPGIDSGVNRKADYQRLQQDRGDSRWRSKTYAGCFYQTGIGFGDTGLCYQPVFEVEGGDTDKIEDKQGDCHREPDRLIGEGTK